MSVIGRLAQLFGYKYILCSVFTVLIAIPANSGRSEPTTSQMPPATQTPSADPAGLTVTGSHAGAATIDELRAHAATIADILETASERVERLAAANGRTPELVDAIRQELALSRRWNRHIGTILLDVTEARRALGERERAAAREIARMTAIAEDARLELVALRKALMPDPAKAAHSLDAWSDGNLLQKAPVDIGNQVASSQSIAEAVIEGVVGPESDLDDAREALATMRTAQKTAIRDADAVRAKIMDALETLVAMQGRLPIKDRQRGAELSSEDITGWAASIATKLNRTPRIEAK